MSNEDILKAVQKQAPNDEYERGVSFSALKIAIAAGVFCMAVMFFVEWFVVKSYDFGKPFLIFLMSGLSDVIEARKRKKGIMMTVGIIALALAAFCLLAYIAGLMGAVG